MDYRYVATLFAMIGARSSRYILFFLAHRMSARCTFANFERRNPILTRPRSTAEPRVVGIETSCTQSLKEEPTPKSNDLAMFRLHYPRNEYQLLRWPTCNLTQCAYSQLANVSYIICSIWHRVGLWQKKGSVVIAHTCSEPVMDTDSENRTLGI